MIKYMYNTLLYCNVLAICFIPSSTIPLFERINVVSTYIV